MSLFIKNEPYTGSCVFSEYPFPLSDFQKHSIDALENNQNVLVSAPTASGKTLVAEHMIRKNSKLNIDKQHQVIYTTPVKALSNFLYNDFVHKFPDISFGIMTGDIKFNPEADCVIMTTEILRNLLYNKKINTDKMELTIEIDVYNNVSGVIFDEVHYIGDSHRGRVWEETLILLPPKIQLVMLSATIEKPEIFAKWVANIKDVPVTLAVNEKRIVPLNYYLYTSFLPKLEKLNKTEEQETNINLFSNKLTLLMDHTNKFNNNLYDISKKTKKNFHQFVSSKAVFNDLALYLRDNNLLPSIVFTLSRKKCELFASQLNVVLNTQEEQSEVMNIFESKVHKCFNYKQITEMKEYSEIKQLVSKGIAYHHSGVYHIFKEIIEMLMAHKNKDGKAQPLIKLLFATETFAIGINIPVKSISYTGLSKYSEQGFRYLHPHEFKQMSGRAGRRGMDTQGVAILLPNLYDLPQANEMKCIMSGHNQLIKSQFIPNFQFLLKLILTGNNQIMRFIKQSLLHSEIDKTNLTLQDKLTNYKISDIDTKIVEFFDNIQTLEEKLTMKISQKERKRIQRELSNTKEEKFYKQHCSAYQKYTILKREYNQIQNDITNNQSYLHSIIIEILSYLQRTNYIVRNISIEDYENIENIHITTKGIVASQINECNEILLTEMISEGYLNNLSKEEICVVLSMFIDSKLNDGNEEYEPNSLDISRNVKNKMYEIVALKDNIIYDLSKDLHQLDISWELYLNMAQVVNDWVLGFTPNQITSKYDIYIGSFVKDIIKLNNIVQNVMTSAEIFENYELQSTCSQIESILVRDIVNMDSIYLK